MAPQSLDTRIDALYQLPLDEFTAARNALAREAGADGREIKALQKPPVAAWAVNQLYWKCRADYDALVEAASTLRAAHTAVLAGRGADLREAGKEHEEAIARALDATLALLRDAGQPATDATRGAIQTTLRALPAGDPPGRLTRVLQPGGFEMLSGIPVRAAPPQKAAARGTKPAGSTPARGKSREADAEAGARARAREAVATAARDLKIAEHAVRLEEFEAARAAREDEKAARALESAREELEAAERAVRDAEAGAREARARRDAARERAEEAEAALSAARARLAAAEHAAAALTRTSK